MTSLRAVRSLDEALALALEDLEAGLSPLQVLNRYSEYEADLAPLLQTAFGLRNMRWPALSLAARVQGRERMHVALAQQKPRRAFSLPSLWRQLGAALVLMALAATTFMAWPGRLGDHTNVATATSTVESAPAPSTTLQTVFPSTATATKTKPLALTPARKPIQPPIRTVEAAETLESSRSVTRAVTSTAQPTRTRPASRTPSATPTSSPTLAARNATVPAQQAPGSGLATETPPPSVTTAPTATSTATVTRPPKPTPTRNPTETPEPSPTWTLVPPRTATATRTPTVWPSNTPRPPTVAPTATATRWPTKTATQTPEPTRTRRPTETSEPSAAPYAEKALEPAPIMAARLRLGDIINKRR